MPPLLADAVSHISGAIGNGIAQTLLQLLLVGGPFFGLTVALHCLEVVIQGRLSRRWGWNSVMFTGWLGTPVHELSHAAMCPIFLHKINKVALFEPDREAGRLGYVSHSFSTDGWQPEATAAQRIKTRWAAIGCFFIGTAPLLGGTLALWGLLWLFFPQSAQSAGNANIGGHIAAGNILDTAVAVFNQAWRVLVGILKLENLGRIVFWAFLYLAMCVGAHMAPSTSDYRGAKPAAIWLLGLLLAFNLIWCLCGGVPARPLAAMASFLSPALALFGLAVILCCLSALVVVGFTELYDAMTGRQQPG